VTEEGSVTRRLAQIYQAYISCLNHQDWPSLETFVDDDVVHNGRPIGLSGYDHIDGLRGAAERGYIRKITFDQFCALTGMRK
jgi:hypothetical protein